MRYFLVLANKHNGFSGVSAIRKMPENWAHNLKVVGSNPAPATNLKAAVSLGKRPLSVVSVFRRSPFSGTLKNLGKG